MFLRYNQITSIQVGALNGIYKLSILDLSYNNLTELKIGQFSTLETVDYIALDYNQIETINENAFRGLKRVQKLFLKFNPLKFIYPIDNLAAFSTIYVSKITLTNLGNKALMKAFAPTEIIKKNVYTYYKAIFFVVDEPDIYDKEFCQLIFDLLRYNILVNFLEYWQVNTILEICLVFDIKPYKKFSFGDKFEL